MDKFLSSLTSFKGTDVKMSWLEMFIYGMIPGLGQLLMRINKFGGSLDKPYLLFPLLLFPPFSFIPVLIAKFGFLEARVGQQVIDIYILIPIIFRFILIFIMAHISQNMSTFGGLMLQVGLLFASVLVANILHIFTEKQCKDIEGGFGNKLIKATSDSMIEYGAGVLVILSSTFIPIVGEILEGMRDIPLPIIGDISSIIDGALWSVGLGIGYLIMNMIDTNYSTAEETCAGRPGLIRIIISVIAFAAAIVYQFHGQLGNIAGDVVDNIAEQVAQ